ncbi:MAG: beta-N-acetylhexosaminidase, partial [Moraxellaceae bacterium]
SQVDANPAGFSPFWLQTIIRQKLGFDGVLFSDDLSMQAACVAGGADARIKAALAAGCDMGLVCNDRTAALQALSALEQFALPNQQRLEKMRGKIPDIAITDSLNHGSLNLGTAWQQAVTDIQTLLA